MIQWQLVFGLLCGEMFICVLLCLPLPLRFRRNILEGLAKLWAKPTVNIIVKTVAVLLLLLFVDSVRSIYDLQAKVDKHLETDKGHASSCDLYLRMFRAQRNSYIVGFSLFLFLLLWRFKEMILELQTIEKKSSAVVSQAVNSQKEYDRLTEEKEKLAKDLAKANETVTEYKSKVASSDAIKKQAENQQKEYMRLLEENDELHRASNAKSKVVKKDE